METKCPNCSRVQSVPDGQEDANVRCQGCHEIFAAKQLSKPVPTPEPKSSADVVSDEIPQFTHFGPGWWLMYIVIVLAVCAICTTLAGEWLLAAWFASGAFTLLVPAIIINYLGYISELIKYGLTHNT
jgi:hypothetical protein